MKLDIESREELTAWLTILFVVADIAHEGLGNGDPEWQVDEAERQAQRVVAKIAASAKKKKK